MRPTKTDDPSYYHKVVGCQWACPAHTNVPEYIRMIAQGRYTERLHAQPGIERISRNPSGAPVTARLESLPRRRTRLDTNCRWRSAALEARVAADQKGDIEHLLPRAPERKNGMRVACVGAGPASLTVANDLMPLGYEVTIFEKYGQPGGLMRTNIPSFRLPESVLKFETDAILDMGVDIRYNSPVSSMKDLLGQGFDAVFVGSGAPRGKDLEIPGRHDSDRIHIGIDWLESITFGHIDKIGEKVLIIGVNNTSRQVLLPIITPPGWQGY